jgi:tRNA/rRNA methyltransferase
LHAGGDIKTMPTTRFVLINTSHAGNVGAAARALKVMGFDDLVLVAPRDVRVLTREETVQRASGATDVLAKARIVQTLDEALQGMTHTCATAMTPRDFGPPTCAPRAYFEDLLSKKELLALNSPGPQADLTHKNTSDELHMAFLFGSERFGMRNDEVYRCHACLSIPTAPDYGSLNLASAVQLIAYEWRMALGAVGQAFAVQDARAPTQLADAPAVQGMLQHWEQALIDLGFLDPGAPKKLMPRLQHLFSRAQLTQEEIHILRGVAKAMIDTRARVQTTTEAATQTVTQAVPPTATETTVKAKHNTKR